MKRAIAIMLSICMIFFSVTHVYAEGEGNADTGGGDTGEALNRTNQWNDGWEGVRVTLIEENAGSISVVGDSVDLTNMTRTQFNEVKAFIGNPTNRFINYSGGNKLDYLQGEDMISNANIFYDFKNPEMILPDIISYRTLTESERTSKANNIKSYFTDAYVLKEIIAPYLGVEYARLISGEYKLLLEPVAYVVYQGLFYALTATEASIFNQWQVAQNVPFEERMSYVLWDVVNQNLPMGLFLETADLGLPVWTGDTTGHFNDADIFSSLGSLFST